MEQYLQLIISVLAGLATAIPLAIKLVEYVRKAVKEKNWPKVVSLVIDLMSEVEDKMDVGADKKAYVLAMIKSRYYNANCKCVNYTCPEGHYECSVTDPTDIISLDNLVYNMMMPYCKVCKRCGHDLEDDLPEIDADFDILRAVDCSENMGQSPKLCKPP